MTNSRSGNEVYDELTMGANGHAYCASPASTSASLSLQDPANEGPERLSKVAYGISRLYWSNFPEMKIPAQNDRFGSHGRPRTCRCRDSRKPTQNRGTRGNHLIGRREQSLPFPVRRKVLRHQKSIRGVVAPRVNVSTRPRASIPPRHRLRSASTTSCRLVAFFGGLGEGVCKMISWTGAGRSFEPRAGDGGCLAKWQ